MLTTKGSASQRVVPFMRAARVENRNGLRPPAAIAPGDWDGRLGPLQTLLKSSRTSFARPPHRDCPRVALARRRLHGAGSDQRPPVRRPRVRALPSAAAARQPAAAGTRDLYNRQGRVGAPGDPPTPTKLFLRLLCTAGPRATSARRARAAGATRTAHRSKPRCWTHSARVRPSPWAPCASPAMASCSTPARRCLRRTAGNRPAGCGP